MRAHLNRPFSTFDRDNDFDSNFNYAVFRRSAWWYTEYDSCNLNGDYTAADTTSSCIFWGGKPGNRYTINGTEMKIRPKI